MKLQTNLNKKLFSLQAMTMTTCTCDFKGGHACLLVYENLNRAVFHIKEEINSIHLYIKMTVL